MQNGYILFVLAFVLLVGTLFGKLAKLCRLPSVTGYLLAGIIFGPSLLGQFSIGVLSLGISSEFLDSLEIIYITAFSFICFSIGEEIKPKNLRKIGGRAFVISLSQAFLAVLLVGGALAGFALITNEKYITLPAALVLGALAASSAPTAKFMITRQYRTEGEITEMMVPVVALDDIFGIIAFSAVIALLPSLSGGDVSIYSLLFSPLIEIISSIAIGIGLGVSLGLITKTYKIQNGRIAVCIAFILAGVAITEIFNGAGLHLVKSTGEGHLSLSAPLVSIFMGGSFSFINHEHGIRKKLDSWSYPMFVVFFVLAGARVSLSDFLIVSVAAISLIYIAFRFLGKYFGSRFGAKIMGGSKNMQKYLGVTLLPQADIAIGMAALAAASISTADASLVKGVVFLAAVVFEIMGHIWIKSGLKKAGEMHGDLDSAAVRLRYSRVRHAKTMNSYPNNSNQTPSIIKRISPPDETKNPPVN